MNRNGAARALEALSAEYDDPTCRRVAEWLQQEFQDIGERYALADVAQKVRDHLHGVAMAGAEPVIDDVVARLMGCEETVLVAVLRTGRLGTSWRTAGVWVGPNSEVG